MTYLVVAIIDLTGTQMSGCNAVQDTLLQAIASSNKGVVGCKKPLDRVFKPSQHRIRNSMWSSSMAPFRSLMGGKDDGSLFKVCHLTGSTARHCSCERQSPEGKGPEPVCFHSSRFSSETFYGTSCRHHPVSHARLLADLLPDQGPVCSGADLQLL
ncbi:hypothetical protein WJX79_003040 [Trebouxia sp. C0005]